MFTRRRFLLTLPALTHRASRSRGRRNPSSLPSARNPPAAAAAHLRLLRHRHLEGNQQGNLSLPLRSRLRPAHDAAQLAAETLRPSYLALSPNTGGQRHLYAVNAVNDASASVTSYLSTPPPARFTPSTSVTSAGAGPCYISLDATGQSAYVANYYGSTIATYRVLPGALSEPSSASTTRSRNSAARPRRGAARHAPSPLRPPLARQPLSLVNDLGSDAHLRLHRLPRHCTPRPTRALHQRASRLRPPPYRLPSQRPLGLLDQRDRLHARPLHLEH